MPTRVSEFFDDFDAPAAAAHPRLAERAGHVAVLAYHDVRDEVDDAVGARFTVRPGALTRQLSALRRLGTASSASTPSSTASPAAARCPRARSC